MCRARGRNKEERECEGEKGNKERSERNIGERRWRDRANESERENGRERESKRKRKRERKRERERRKESTRGNLRTPRVILVRPIC